MSVIEQIKAAQNKLAEGVQAHAEDVVEAVETTVEIVPPEVPTPEEVRVLAPYEPKAGDVKSSIRVNSVILANGKRIKANIAGYYEQPKGELLDILKEFIEKGLCTLVK